ncbi:glutathione S-transferase N-terminal domain-containing protein [Bacillus sp. NTK074B]|uniref:glutaredoxin domain-containing protein n=1 Tax=Bacillus sp. NTK074B TaxID=2802174 RepID=UPI001A9045A3|nr:glutathione S-transferase N-terminal domain-containing protein [Bacillus sp. NTK074B]
MKEVTLYSQPECPPCEVVKMFLNEHKVKFKEINIKADEQARYFLTNQLKSYSTPTVTIGREIITGFDLEALTAALNL